MPETERQSIVRLTRESEAEDAEATARENAGPSAGGTSDSDMVKQAEGNNAPPAEDAEATARENAGPSAGGTSDSHMVKQAEGNNAPPDFSSDSSDSSSDESDYSTPANGGGGAHPPTWTVSVKRILGARVYARYLNGQWYWANIVRVRGSYREKNLRFRVLFEDGDDLEDLESEHMITEKEYISENREGEERYPPYPKPKRRRLKRLLDEAKGKKPTAEGNDKVATAASASSPAAMSVTAAILQSNITVSPPAKKQRQDLESNAAATAIAVPMEVQLANRPGAQTDTKVCEAPDAPITSSNHFLVGKGYACEWTDVYGENKIIYGTIVKRVDIDLFEVSYSEASRKALVQMSKKSVFGSPPSIPETQKIREDAAWGGAACFERKMLLRRGPDSVIRNLTRDKPCVTVIVPDTRHHKLVEYKGRQVPEVILTVRGFKLVFSVKESTISGAGLGVFVKCTSFRNAGPETFELMAGELLDIGVYSPLTANDKKHSHVFNCKTYAFSMRTEQYSFDSPEDGYLFDISDDKTGEPHETARHHLPMYVNETMGTDTVHAENDPEGNVHYMMGLRYNGNWSAHVKDAKEFALQADGKTEKELFVHYGETYEEVRIREGYSIKTQKEQKAVLRRAAQHQREFVLEVFIYPPESLESCVDFFLTKLIPENLYGEGGQGKLIDPDLRDRALHMSRMFRIRGERILDTITKNREMAAESVDSPTAKRYDPTEGIDIESLMIKIHNLIERLIRLSCTRAVPAFSKEMERQLIAEAEEFHETPSDYGYKSESETDSDEDNSNADDSDSSYEE